MTRLLEEAIAELRELPADEQEMVVDVVFKYLSSEERHYYRPSSCVRSMAPRLRRPLTPRSEPASPFPKSM